MTTPISFSCTKKQGEWVELQFLARATGHGFTVSKPWGDSTPYDFVLECNRTYHRVQVKSTSIRSKGTYECIINNTVHGRRQYQPGAFDFYAIFVMPENMWYLIPAADVKHQTAVCMNPRNPKNRYIRYLEAWHLFREPLKENSAQVSGNTASPQNSERNDTSYVM